MYGLGILDNAIIAHRRVYERVPLVGSQNKRGPSCAKPEAYSPVPYLFSLGSISTFTEIGDINPDQKTACDNTGPVIVAEPSSPTDSAATSLQKLMRE
jgi:hypothetical protein